MNSSPLLRFPRSLFLAAITLLAAVAQPQRVNSAEQPNIIFILADDHRYDAMGFLGKFPWLQTPNMDRMAREGAHLPNAFVTTSLCSPSRASIITGQYMHKHGIVDNVAGFKPNAVLFPEYLQRAGYATAFIGKWHMGSDDSPRPGFDHWVSFAGQGHYYPNNRTMMNINGDRVAQKGYITDELTDYSLEWLSNERDQEKPFFLYLSHKAVHANFSPAERHRNLYTDAEIKYPETYADTEENYHLKPRWVKDQRNSWHGVDFPYHSTLDVREYFRDYCRALAAVDESIGRVLDHLGETGLDRETLVIYMGDNGFLFGEHGLIDKRNAYEESMRVPMLAWGPGLFEGGKTVNQVVANVDIAPTVLGLAGLPAPAEMDGRNFFGLLTGQTSSDEWRKWLLYEYYWEFSFPQTPTTYALRGERYKLIQYHGIWDSDELYDLQNDPLEQENLIWKQEHASLVNELRRELGRQLVAANASSVPFNSKRNHGNAKRIESGSGVSEFPEPFVVEEPINRRAQ